VLVTLVLVYRAGRTTRTASDYYAAGRGFTGPQNGVAIAGDYLSAASFLGIAGAIAVNGYDGFLYSIGFLVAWLVALLLVAELMRNTGRYTMGDVLAYRMRQRPVRAAAATSTLGRLGVLPARADGRGGRADRAAAADPAGDRIGQGLVIVVVGTLMIFYVLVGGMKGTTVRTDHQSGAARCSAPRCSPRGSFGIGRARASGSCCVAPRPAARTQGRGAC
jgi:cation/acetate symporter